MQNHANGQLLTKRYIDDWMAKWDTSFKSQTRVLYILNGVPINSDDTTKFNDQLNGVDIKDCWIDYLSKDQLINSLIICTQPNDVILLGTKRDAAHKSKKKTLKLVKTKFLNLSDHANKDVSNETDPVVIIDNKLVDRATTRQVLNSLKLNSIYDIAFLHQAPTDYYGPYAKNGLVKIWTVPQKNSSQKLRVTKVAFMKLII